MTQTYIRGTHPDGSSGLAKLSATDELVVSLAAGGGAVPTTVPTNATVTVATTTTLVLAANPNRTSALLKNTGTQSVFLAFGEAATTAKFPLAANETLRVANPLAVNGIVAATTATVAVLEEAHA